MIYFVPEEDFDWKRSQWNLQIKNTKKNICLVGSSYHNELKGWHDKFSHYCPEGSWEDWVEFSKEVIKADRMFKKNKISIGWDNSFMKKRMENEKLEREKQKQTYNENVAKTLGIL